MIFSQPDLAEYLSETFECAWEELRPVPKVHIEFGNGYELERTLDGNIVTWFCSPQGEVIDAIPGLVVPEAFRNVAERAERWAAQLARARKTDGDSQVRIALANFYSNPPSVVDVSQMIPESNFPNRSKVMLQGKLRAQIVRPSLAATHTPPHVASTVFSSGEPSPRQSIPSALGPVTWSHVEADSRYNMTRCRPELHVMLSGLVLASPHELHKRVYRDILHADLDDPYLGLAEGLEGKSGPGTTH